MDDDVLRLHVVSHTAVHVDASSQKPPAWPSAVLPADEIELGIRSSLDLWLADVHIAPDARHAKGRVLKTPELLQHVVIKRVLWHDTHTVRVLVAHVQECFLRHLLSLRGVDLAASHFFQDCVLQVLRQVKLVRKVKGLLSLDVLDHVNERLVLWMNEDQCVSCDGHKH